MKITHDDEVQSAKISGISPAELEHRNRKTVKTLYKALLRGDNTETLEKLVGEELEWWYHGPPNCHHMMKSLTGESTHQKGGGFFVLKPRRMRAIGEYWVHAWRLNKDGIIYQLREYFNTLVTVVVLESDDGGGGGGGSGGGGDGGGDIRLWRSTPWARAQGSFPALVLAI